MFALAPKPDVAGAPDGRPEMAHRGRNLVSAPSAHAGGAARSKALPGDRLLVAKELPRGAAVRQRGQPHRRLDTLLDAAVRIG